MVAVLGGVGFMVVMMFCVLTCGLGFEFCEFVVNLVALVVCFNSLRVSGYYLF